MKRESTEESKRNTDEIKELTNERNKWKEELKVVGSFFEMERDNAATYKAERDELRIRLERLEGEYKAALKQINPNDPKAVPRAQLEDPLTSAVKEELKVPVSKKSSSAKPLLTAVKLECYVPPPPTDG